MESVGRKQQELGQLVAVGVESEVVKLSAQLEKHEAREGGYKTIGVVVVHLLALLTFRSMRLPFTHWNK